MFGLLPFSRLVAVGALIALVPVEFEIPVLALVVAVALIVMVLAVWNALVYGGQARLLRRSTM
jgi:phosphate starvation-inducible membrane PsiE